MTQQDYTKRTGKFRHIYGDLPKPENQYTEIPVPLSSGEGSYVKASAKFFAFSSPNPNKLYVRRLDKPGRLTKNLPYVTLSTLSGKLWDFDFNPFIDTMVAIGADNCKIGIALLPKEGLTENFTEATATLSGHAKKVSLVTFNPSAASILASGSFDRTVKVWNIEQEEMIVSFDQFKDNIYSVAWNGDGSQVAVTSKDKSLRIFDPRDTKNETTSLSVKEAFDSGKSSKIFWIPRLNWIGAAGFNKLAKRELKFWDLRDMSKEIYSNQIDQASSVLMPHWDDDNGVLYLPGKGEGTVQFGEIVNDAKKFYPLGAYRNPEPQKGGGWVPKRGLDVWKCEVQRFLKLAPKAVRPISFLVPRKAGADVFQEDIFPDCAAAKAATTADDWVKGTNNPIERMAMDPAKRSDDDSQATFVKKKTYNELEAENAQLLAEVNELRAKLGMPPRAGDDDEKTDDNNDNADATMTSAAATDDNADNADNADADNADA